MVHSMAYKKTTAKSAQADDTIKIGWKPVVITNYQPNGA
jgi:hypothetical protein